jgi:hypothetical protein
MRPLHTQKCTQIHISVAHTEMHINSHTYTHLFFGPCPRATAEVCHQRATGPGGRRQPGGSAGAAAG